VRGPQSASGHSGVGPGVHLHPAALRPTPCALKRRRPVEITAENSRAVYLFRDRDSSNTFAYCVDVTGRDIPQRTVATTWAFVTVLSDLHMPEEVMRHLQRSGYYVFER
jgi:hypothetical protein